MKQDDIAKKLLKTSKLAVEISELRIKLSQKINEANKLLDEINKEKLSQKINEANKLLDEINKEKDTQ